MTDQIKLRAVEPDDIDFLYRIETLPQVWRVSWGDGPVSRQMMWSYINNYSADIYADRQLRQIIEFNGTPVGTLDLSDFDPRNSRALVGIAIEREYQGRGIGKAAMQELITRCRETLGLHQLAALVPRDNASSLALFESVGFQTSGCLRSWIRRGKGYGDVVIMQLML